MRPTLLAAAMVVGLAGPCLAVDSPAGIEFFETKIRPVLVEHCVKCHGDKKQRGDFRLDGKAALLKAIVPGHADKSLLIKALRHQEPKMPPGKKLPDAVIADFVKWIDMGAPDPRDGTATTRKAIDWATARDFWAFQPPKRHQPPKVADAAWPQGPIDRFILAKLEEGGLRPVKEASKRELLRRATFDLLGLPPTPEEMDAFLNDSSPQAYEKAIQRLLDSPHYGERWGRYWLDVARYAEDQAHTFGVKPNTNAWRYRDWVIRAFNEDMPYDRFVKLQIAADLIEKDEASFLAHAPALGFFGLGNQYYRDSALTAALAAADELHDRVDTLTRGFLGLTVSCARCHDHMFDPIPQTDYYSLSGVFASSKLADIPVVPKEEQKKVQAHLERIKKVQGEIGGLLQAEREKLAEAKVDAVATYLLASREYLQKKAANPKLQAKDHARSVKLDPTALERCVKFLQAGASDPLLGALVKAAGQAERGIEQAAEFEKSVRAALAAREAKKPLEKGRADTLRKLFGKNGVFDPTDGALKAQLRAEAKKRFDGLEGELAALKKDPAAKPLPVAHGLAEGKAADAKLNIRGNPLKLGEVVPRRFLRVLAGAEATPFTQGSGRLELAEAIADPANPLTARVLVNRIWMHHFGRALVGTPSNFGQLGERPTHPELLDDLAVRFMEGGWSIKKLHREIMLSATYRMSSAFDEAAFARDPDNRLYWRMNRRRLDVEAWRDAMLAVSGKLDPTLGGPTVNLSQDQSRRTVYAKVSRHNLDPLLRMFDFPDANITSERRTETTVPQQQLFFLNSPFATGMARALAGRMAQEKDEAARVQRGFRLAYGRDASADELRDALGFVRGNDDPAERGSNQLTRWERLAQALLGSNEFLYID